MSHKLTREDADTAHDAWGFNCGPSAICALFGISPDQLRPHVGDFERKHYTNPTLMFEILRNLGATWKLTYRGDDPAMKELGGLARSSLVRIQWGGTWTRPGVPMRARYRMTHWIAVHNSMVFDINALPYQDGWISRAMWALKLVPWLIPQLDMKGADGSWWITHDIEVVSYPGWPIR